MKSTLRMIALLSAVSALPCASVSAQQAGQSATYISAEDIKANLNGAPNAATNPSPNIRVVNEGSYNVAVGVLHRPETPPGVAALHHRCPRFIT